MQPVERQATEGTAVCESRNTLVSDLCIAMQRHGTLVESVSARQGRSIREARQVQPQGAQALVTDVRQLPNVKLSQGCVVEQGCDSLIGKTP